MVVLLKNLLAIIAALIFATSAFAADIYLDIAATGCTGGGSSDSDYDPATRSCGSGSDTVYAGNNPRAFGEALGDNDHGYIRAGEYYDNTMSYGGWTHGIIEMNDANVTIENYNSEVVWLETGTDHTGNMQASELNNPITVQGSGNTLKGNGYNFFIWGAVVTGGANNTIQGMDISGGFDKEEGYPEIWADLIRTTNNTNLLIKDNKLHDNSYGCGTSCDFNDGAIMHGTAAGTSNEQDTIVENNYFYNIASYIGTPKYQDEDSPGTIQATYRKNFIKDSVLGIAALFSSGGQYVEFYQNVVVNGSGSVVVNGVSQGTRVYNNTFYITAPPHHISYSFAETPINDLTAYNNIFYYTGATTIYAHQHDGATGIGTAYIDYNNYYQAGSGNVRFFSNYTNRTFAQWQTWTGQESNSITTDPGFNPDDSTLDGDEPMDFKRTAYTTNGRGGAYPAVMGAYITGNEVIGLLNGQPSNPNPTITPTFKIGNGVRFGTYKWRFE